MLTKSGVHAQFRFLFFLFDNVVIFANSGQGRSSANSRGGRGLRSSLRHFQTERTDQRNRHCAGEVQVVGMYKIAVLCCSSEEVFSSAIVRYLVRFGSLIVCVCVCVCNLVESIYCINTDVDTLMVLL